MLSNKKTWIDCYKGIGAILILIGHIMPFNNPIKVFLYSFHIPLFFFISGYLYNDKRSFADTFKKKMNTLIKPFIIWNSISFIIYMIFTYDGSLTKIEMVKNLIFFNGSTIFNSSLWFLPILFYVDIIYKFIIRNKPTIKNNLILIFLFFTIGTILIKYKINLMFGLSLIPFMMIFYCLGCIFKKMKKIKNILPNKIIFVFLLVILILLSNLNGKVTISINQYNNLFLFFVNSIIGIYLVYSISYKLKENKFLKAFSNISLLMFCTQRIIFQIIVWIENKLNFKILWTDNYLINICLILLFISIYYLFYCFKERKV